MSDVISCLPRLPWGIGRFTPHTQAAPTTQRSLRYPLYNVFILLCVTKLPHVRRMLRRNQPISHSAGFFS